MNWHNALRCISYLGAMVVEWRLVQLEDAVNCCSFPQTLRHTMRMQTSWPRGCCELLRWLWICRMTGLWIRLTNMCQHYDRTTTPTKRPWWSQKVPSDVRHIQTTGPWQFWSQVQPGFQSGRIQWQNVANMDSGWRKGKQLRNRHGKDRRHKWR